MRARERSGSLLRPRRVPLRLLAALALLPATGAAAPGDITTYAGGLGQGPGVNLGQGVVGVATFGSFVYSSDETYHVIRRLDTTTGDQVVVAGTGEPGFSGDGGPAMSARLDGPRGLAVDAAGHLFIADAGNQRVRRVDAPTAILATVAGSGFPGFDDDGAAVSSRLFGPIGVAVDAGGLLYIADSGNHRVRRVDAGTGIITTVAGDGTGGFAGDGGPATAAPLNESSGGAVSAAGHLFIADTKNLRIRLVEGATPCGDGTLDPREDCDDGNTVGGDCCSASCHFEPPASPCDDGDVCTLGDACLAGVCAGLAAPQACRAPIQAGKASLQLTDKAGRLKDKLKFRWTKGAATPDGLTKLQLKAGPDGRAQAQVQGAGGRLRVPAPLLGGGLRVELRTTAGGGAVCWGADLTTVQRNVPGRFRAKGP